MSKKGCTLDQAEQAWTQVGSDDGVVREKLFEYLCSHGISTQHDLEKCFDALDTDKDGTITKNEFILAVCPKEDRETAMRRFYKEMDCDCSGSLTVEEVKAKLGDTFNKIKKAEEVFALFDKDGEKGLSLDEFVALMNACFD